MENELGLEKIDALLTDIKIEEIKWGNSRIAKRLLSQTINQQGIGKLISQGTRKMAHDLGVDPELAAHVKGLEIPMHDPRAYVSQGLTYMTSSTGANHNKCDYFNVDGDAISFPSFKIKRNYCCHLD